MHLQRKMELYLNDTRLFHFLSALNQLSVLTIENFSYLFLICILCIIQPAKASVITSEKNTPFELERVETWPGQTLDRSQAPDGN